MATTKTASAPDIGTVGFLRWMWRQLTSMRTALILLFLLAVASIPGSIFPQRGIDPILVESWIADAPTMGPILDALGFFDVYASPWFAAVYILLFLSLIGCVLPRTKQHWEAMRSQPPDAPKNLARLPGYAETITTDPDVLARVERVLRSQRWRVKSGVGWIAAEKGYARETGNLVFHLALIGILVGVAIGALFGWRGNVIIKEGDGFSNTLTQYDAWGGGRLASADRLAPFGFTLDAFRADFDRREAQFGAPSLFEADVLVRPDPASADEPARIEVNSPLTIDGVKVFLVGHGYAPRFQVRDSAGQVVLDDAVVFLPQDGNFTSTGVIKVPDAEVGFEGVFLPTAVLVEGAGPQSAFPAPDDPAVFLTAWVGDLGLDDGVPQSIYRLVTDDMEQVDVQIMRPGDVWRLPSGDATIAFTGLDRWASFQIARDPGKELALAASIIATLGLMASLFIRRRRLWVRVAPGENGDTVVQVGALGRSPSVDVQPDIDAAIVVAQGGGSGE
jgi:cytochrome c biogenesis protein